MNEVFAGLYWRRVKAIWPGRRNSEKILIIGYVRKITRLMYYRHGAMFKPETNIPKGIFVSGLNMVQNKCIVLLVQVNRSLVELSYSPTSQVAISLGSYWLWNIHLIEVIEVRTYVIGNY